jgi:ribosomal protein L13E
MLMSINKPIVKRLIRNVEVIRKGRGFSMAELREAGITNVKIARKNGIPVDVLRKTKIPENIEQLRPIAGKILESRKKHKESRQTKSKG